MNLSKISLVGLLVFSLVLFCSGCTEVEPGQGELGAGTETGTETVNVSGTVEPIVVVVSILPQAEFVEAVGGDRVKTIVMIPPGANPATHEPTSGQLRDVSKARMYAIVGTGLPFEEVWLDKMEAVNGDMLIVDCSEGILLRDMAAHFHEEEYAGEDATEYAGEEAEDHVHVGKDPHIWTSPVNSKVMVENIYEGLVQLDPANAEYYRQNKEAYQARLDTLDTKIRAELKGYDNRNFMVFHPSWGYFADEYGLTMIPIEIEGKEPSAQDLTRMVDLAKEKNIKVIFTQAQFSTRSAESVAEDIGGAVVPVDPLAPNYLENMEEVSGIFARNLA